MNNKVNDRMKLNFEDYFLTVDAHNWCKFCYLEVNSYMHSDINGSKQDILFQVDSDGISYAAPLNSLQNLWLQPTTLREFKSIMVHKYVSLQ